jgi:hypothetical protein
MSEKLKYFIEAWEMNGVGQTVATVQDSPGTVVSITVDDLRALLARQPAAIDKGEAVYVPVEPTEAMIRAACLNQSKAQFSSYEEWLDSHSSGVSERIRDLVSGDYRAMIAAAPAIATVAPAVDAQPVAWRHKATKILRNDSIAKGADFESADWEPLYTAAQSEGLRKLDAPAQVAGTVFRSGISWETVIKAAQRNYRYRNDPATNDYPDTFTLEQIQAMDKIIPQGDREFVGLKDYHALANEFAALSQKESGE